MNKKLTKRQVDILGFIRKQGKASNKQILEFLSEKFGEMSRVTVVRDIDHLLVCELIYKIGKGRGVVYSEKTSTIGHRYFDMKEYFQKTVDERDVAHEKFNFKVLDLFKSVFTKERLDEINKITNGYQKRTKTLSPAQFKKEAERLTVEFSWKSSHIEGNTYSLVDTEILIKEQTEAEGHKKEEAVMILNHKKALEHVYANKKLFKELTVRKVENIHRLLTEDLGIEKGIRKRLVGIIGTRYRPLDNEHQIMEMMEKLVCGLNKIPNPFERAFVAVLMISYIQPFEDGNKRTARLLGNAILFSNDMCPLSYRNVDESQYKKAMILFYEQNSFFSFKELFVEQYKFAVQNYFL